jgi:hypothetical protein
MVAPDALGLALKKDRRYRALARKEARPESGASIKRRMTDLIIRRVSADGRVTHDDLVSGGFTQEQIDTWYRPALTQARVHRLGVDL